MTYSSRQGMTPETYGDPMVAQSKSVYIFLVLVPSGGRGQQPLVETFMLVM